jgi:uroporphyrinogen decarboxylase
MPILSFPGGQLAGRTIREMVNDPAAQVEVQNALRRKFGTSFLLSAMDLSVEAEEFGASVIFSDHEIPSVTGRRVTDRAGIDALQVPRVGGKRTAVYLQTVRELVAAGHGLPVLGGMIGPFSLAGRLFGVSEALLETAMEPGTMHALIEKATAFLTAYAGEFKKAGAWGVIVAEPTAGLMSPASAAEFSSPYVRRIIEAVSDDQFEIVLHNCGARLAHLKASLQSSARILHFGKPMDLLAALAEVSHDIVLCGNLDPSEVFVGSSPAEVRSAAGTLLSATAARRNFVISSGCDVPPNAPLANIEALFKAVEAHQR